MCNHIFKPFYIIYKYGYFAIIMLSLGIDEAGRGPCVGSLFIVGAMFKEKDLGKLKSIGVKDSKLLTHKKRVELEKEIKKIANTIKIIKVAPQEIDSAVDGDKSMNLNWLEAIKQAEIINELKPDKAIIDCPSPNCNAYERYLRKLLNNQEIELIIEHKADKNFVECSSASVIAKVEREKEVEAIEKMVGESIGSGYSSNTICQKFIKDNFEKYPGLFRKSWSTWKNHNHMKKQKRLEEF